MVYAAHTHEEAEAQGRCVTCWASWQARGRSRGQAAHPGEGATGLTGGWGCCLAMARGLAAQLEGYEGQGREDGSCLSRHRPSLSKE